MELKKNINIEVDSINQILWLEIGTNYELHYSYETICNFYDSLEIIKRVIQNENLLYVLMKSSNKKVWSMGGDIELFLKCIKNKEINQLKDYAYKCVKGVHSINNNFQTDAVTACILEGNAFGGGFECALSANYIIAEEQVAFSFPETLFGTFPGMGGYSLLTRKLGFDKAEEMINSGQKWSTSEMHNLGLVSHVAETGKGIAMTLNLISQGMLMGKNEFSKTCTTPSINELIDIVDQWIDQVMNLRSSKLDFMQKIVDAQKKLV